MTKTVAEHNAAYLSRISQQDFPTLVEWLLESYEEAQRGLIYECYGGDVLDRSLRELEQELAAYRERLAELVRMTNCGAA